MCAIECSLFWRDQTSKQSWIPHKRVKLSKHKPPLCNRVLPKIRKVMCPQKRLLSLLVTMRKKKEKKKKRKRRMNMRNRRRIKKSKIRLMKPRICLKKRWTIMMKKPRMTEDKMICHKQQIMARSNKNKLQKTRLTLKPKKRWQKQTRKQKKRW